MYVRHTCTASVENVEFLLNRLSTTQATIKHIRTIITVPKTFARHEYDVAAKVGCCALFCSYESSPIRPLSDRSRIWRPLLRSWFHLELAKVVYDRGTSAPCNGSSPVCLVPSRWHRQSQLPASWSKGQSRTAGGASIYPHCSVTPWEHVSEQVHGCVLNQARQQMESTILHKRL